MARKVFLMVIVCFGHVLVLNAQNSFPTSGNASIGGMNYLTTGSRVYMQYPANLANNWSRGLLSQGIYWDNSLALWQVTASSTNSDFSLIRFENSGRIGFFNRGSTGSGYTLDNNTLENYRHMTILTNGNVGIGIITPAEKLAVNGNIRAKEVKVETANWPDYVFEDNYKLPDLDETARYIKNHKHLPGMPSTREVAEKGVSLGEMNRKLLEKVEELVLLIIDKDLEIKDLRNLLDNFKQRLEKLEQSPKD